MSRFVIGITGASGSLYARKTTEILIRLGYEAVLVASRWGKEIFRDETGEAFEDWAQSLGEKARVFSNDQADAPIASGSYPADGMAVAPCSMATLGRIASGTSDNLICRAADVALKERRPLVLLVREAPYNLIHINNMQIITQAGGIIYPASPSFYSHPSSIDDLVTETSGRVAELLGVDNPFYYKWKNEKERLS